MQTKPLRYLAKWAMPPLFLLSHFCFLNAQAQGSSRMKEVYQKMAIEKGYGILFCQVDSTAVTAMTTDFTGLIDINIKSDQLDTLFNKKELQTEGSRKAMMQLAQLLVKQGVAAREKQKSALAVLCYRIPLQVTCAANERTGMRIISQNAWFAWNDLKGAAPNSLEEKAQQLLELDAKKLASAHKNLWNAELTSNDQWNKDIFLSWHRLALFAHNKVLSTDLVLNALARINARDKEACLMALLEELAATQSWEILQQLVSDANAQKETEPFQRLWKYYTELHSAYTQDPRTWLSRMEAGLYQFEVIRASVASAGGSFGHKLSYQVSEYLQTLGSDLALLYALNGDMLSALQTSERVRARNLGEWIARSHASDRLEPFNIRDQNKTQPYFNSLRVATLSEIASVARANNAPILIYLNTQAGYLTWFIQPAGTFYAGFISNGDSLVHAALSSLPFGVPIDRNTRNITIKSRSTIKSTARNTATDVNAVLSNLYQQLLPDSIGIQAASESMKKLIIIPDGQLNMLPFAALKTAGGKYLLEQVAVQYIPSVSSLLLIKSSELAFDADKRYPIRKEPISIMGNPDFKGKYTTTVSGITETVALDPLPGTAREVDAISRLFNTGNLQQQQVRTDSVLRPTKVKMVHLATHGFSNMENGMQSFVAFSDGPLYAEQLYEEAGVLKTKMVVLSACETGLGNITKDSPIGLTTAFLVGGANSVVSTLWSIDDDASAELMVHFYEQVQAGKDITRALQFAQLELMKNPKWASPFFWAAFKQTGSELNPLQ